MLTFRCWPDIGFLWLSPSGQGLLASPAFPGNRLKSFHGQGNSICSGTRTGNSASASMCPLRHHHIHGWTSPGFPAPAPALLTAPATAAMLQSLYFSPRLLQKLWNCSSCLGSCPFRAQNPPMALLRNIHVQGPPWQTTARPTTMAVPRVPQPLYQCQKNSDSCPSWVPSSMLVTWPGLPSVLFKNAFIPKGSSHMSPAL